MHLLNPLQTACGRQASRTAEILSLTPEGSNPAPTRARALPIPQLDTLIGLANRKGAQSNIPPSGANQATTCGSKIPSSLVK
ncbi:hypothetical protein VD0004_g5180 [Verticillium dahliae]|uniref:Uncharacterized protein n=1 Tax=Verticillium dahliae TaxID=27337 RepID=A0AA45APG9_VERDA|nr:hypothetical protein BJF96_g2739 [Verticillium dahliae]PNH42028.1 hypothetical protein VD0004_g5180 [Verticillium dahliae]PNH74687.1 hypothetical protein VD0001_g2893 [Verticillium dahliae]